MDVQTLGMFDSGMSLLYQLLAKNFPGLRVASMCNDGGVWKHTPPSELAREEAPRYLKAINFLLEPEKARILALVRSPVAHLYAWRKAGYDISKCVGRSGFS